MSDPARRPIIRITLLIVFLVASLVLGMVGGVTGFVFLSNSRSAPIGHFRQALGLDSVTIPVTQNIHLDESSGVIDAAKKVSPAVVAISGSQEVTDFFGQTSTQQTSGGSGFILTADGLIITNKHVVDAAGTYKVVLSDGRILDASIKAVDPLNDLAVVKVNAQDLPTVELGSSDDLKIGQSVLAIGNALGEFPNSVTAGVLSAKERSIQAGSETDATGEALSGLLQTDAAINPGNSGGPLVNLAGQVVGINTAIASTTGGSIGVGFAIPIDSVRNVLKSVQKTGAIVRPYLGVRYVPVTDLVKAHKNLSVNYGDLVSKGSTAADVAVLAGSPADKAGIVEGDILLEINGAQINQDMTLAEILQKYNVGDQVTIKLLRGGTVQVVKAALDQSPS